MLAARRRGRGVIRSCPSRSGTRSELDGKPLDAAAYVMGSSRPSGNLGHCREYSDGTVPGARREGGSECRGACGAGGASARRRKKLDDTHRAAQAGQADVGTLTESEVAGIVAPAPEFGPRLPASRPTYARTSLIIDPPDGRIPALTPQARARLEQREAARYNRGEADSWVDRNSWERCITRTLPLGMLSTYASNYQILQTPDYFVVFVEMIHEPRIIPLDGRPHLAAGLRQWLGDSRGHWEGDTLDGNIQLPEQLGRCDVSEGGSGCLRAPRCGLLH